MTFPLPSCPFCLPISISLHTLPQESWKKRISSSCWGVMVSWGGERPLLGRPPFPPPPMGWNTGRGELITAASSLVRLDTSRFWSKFSNFWLKSRLVLMILLGPWGTLYMVFLRASPLFPLFSLFSSLHTASPVLVQMFWLNNISSSRLIKVLSLFCLS